MNAVAAARTAAATVAASAASAWLPAGGQHGPTETAEGRHDRLGCGQLFHGCAHECGWPGRVRAATWVGEPGSQRVESRDGLGGEGRGAGGVIVADGGDLRPPRWRQPARCRGVGGAGMAAHSLPGERLLAVDLAGRWDGMMMLCLSDGGRRTLPARSLQRWCSNRKSSGTWTGPRCSSPRKHTRTWRLSSISGGWTRWPRRPGHACRAWPATPCGPATTCCGPCGRCLSSVRASVAMKRTTTIRGTASSMRCWTGGWGCPSRSRWCTWRSAAGSACRRRGSDCRGISSSAGRRTVRVVRRGTWTRSTAAES